MIRFLDSTTDKDKRLSTTQVISQDGIYVGLAKCHPDDHWSELTGCRIAEQRAKIKALKARLEQVRHDCDECRKFVRAVECYKTFDKESPTAKAIYRQQNMRIKEVNKIIEDINNAEFALRVMIRKQNQISKIIESENKVESN